MHSIKRTGIAWVSFAGALLVLTMIFIYAVSPGIAFADELDEDKCVAHILNPDGTIAENGHIASFGTTTGDNPDISSFNTAVQGMQEGQSIQFLEDLILDTPANQNAKRITLKAANADTVIDLNGHKTNASIYALGSGSFSVTVKNGAIEYTGGLSCIGNANESISIDFQDIAINVAGPLTARYALVRTTKAGSISLKNCTINYEADDSSIIDIAYIADASKGSISFESSSITVNGIKKAEKPLLYAGDGGHIQFIDANMEATFDIAGQEGLISQQPRAVCVSGSGSSVTVNDSSIICTQQNETGNAYCIGIQSPTFRDGEEIIAPSATVSNSVLKATAGTTSGDAAAIYLGAYNTMYPYANAALTIDGAVDFNAPIIVAEDKAINVGPNLSLADGASPIDVVVGGYEFNADNAKSVANAFINHTDLYGHYDGTLTDDVFAIGVDGADISSKAACFKCPPSAGAYNSPYATKSLIKPLTEGNKLAFADKDLSTGSISVADYVMGGFPAVTVTYADEAVPADCYTVSYLDENGEELSGLPTAPGTYYAIATAVEGSGYENSITSVAFQVLAAASADDIAALNEQIEQLKADLAAAKEQLAAAQTKADAAAAQAALDEAKEAIEQLKAQVAELSKAEQSIKVTPASKSFKASKKTKKLAKAKSFTIKVAGAKGTVTKTFKITKKASKKISVSKTGKVKLKKGAKKGTYKIKVTVKASGDSAYKAKTYTKTITIKVK